MRLVGPLATFGVQLVGYRVISMGAVVRIAAAASTARAWARAKQHVAGAVFLSPFACCGAPK